MACGERIDGILVVAKPSGMTSHDVVARVRRMTGEKRVGHAGTLDPDASGVLVVLMGRATSAMRFMLELSKAYRAEIVLGVVTDTHDASGRVVRVAEEVKVSEQLFREVLKGYEGEILQVPPMVSAVHHEGRRLYELAREGIEVEREPRRVTIYRADVESWPDGPIVPGSRISVDVVCSSGTYIRQLAADVGESLGCGAHLGSLVRTRAGPFLLSSAHDLDEIAAAAKDGRIRDLVLPISAGLSHLPAVVVTGEDARRIACGAPVEVPAGTCVRGTLPADDDPTFAGGGPFSERLEDLVRVHSDTGELLGVARAEGAAEGRMRLRPLRMFVG
ncbi:MAG: tRNA pseudouridine(55) synthase TruB [Firmicutes bacterium]|jgi:tRNA pseudouridine55 synthase|nr:tRNA pseudouridine(55) synthase TruB [Bacillota bacterium]MDH7495509.1 tRNA pseudouridine(55) synthase TruB [Bacillota bacterium]